MKHLRKVIEFTPGFTFYGDTEQYFGPTGSGLRWMSQQYIDALAAAAWRELDRQDKFVIIPFGTDRHRIYRRQPFEKLAEVEGDRHKAVIELIGGILE